MTGIYITLPFWILLFSAAVCGLFWNSPRVQQVVSVTGAGLFLIAAVLLISSVYQNGILVIQIGDWPAPFGISLVADLLSSIMILITAVVGFAVIMYATDDISPQRKTNGFFPVFHFMLLGVTGAFLAGDVFNMYVWFEVMLVASFVLIALGNTRDQLEGSVKYVILNFISSGFFLTGVGVLYKTTGSLNMADLAVIVNEPDADKGMLTLSAVFFFMSFGIKAAVFPLFFWLPASYPTPPVSIAGLLAGLLTKVGVYALIRFFTLIFVHDTGLTHTFLLIISGVTMLSGVLGALIQNDIRKILSFHIISQIGYMIMGLALFTPLAIAAAIFYMIHHILVKTNLFLISGILKVINGNFLLKKLGGIYDNFPGIALLFVIAAFSLAGIPPLSGFWGKFLLAKSGLEAGQPLIVGISLAVGLLTLFSMTKIWQQAFWSKAPEKEESAEIPLVASPLSGKSLMILSVVFLALCTLFISFFPDFLVSFSNKASEQLLNPEGYINAVLNK